VPALIRPVITGMRCQLLARINNIDYYSLLLFSADGLVESATGHSRRRRAKGSLTGDPSARFFFGRKQKIK